MWNSRIKPGACACQTDPIAPSPPFCLFSGVRQELRLHCLCLSSALQLIRHLSKPLSHLLCLQFEGVLFAVFCKIHTTPQPRAAPPAAAAAADSGHFSCIIVIIHLVVMFLYEQVRTNTRGSDHHFQRACITRQTLRVSFTVSTPRTQSSQWAAQPEAGMRRWKV